MKTMNKNVNYESPRVDSIDILAEGYGYTLHKTQFTNATGCLIRPVLVEESAE